MKQLAYILTLILALASCSHRQEAAPSDADSTVQAADTTLLRVAVMPAMSCLPLYYAAQSGLADSLGIHLELLRHQAQLDIDTTILRHHADIAFTDLIRAERLAAKAAITPFLSCMEPLSLISQKSKRVKRINQMQEQMIAISRLSATDFWCDHILDSTHTSHDDIYRPQINDVRLRSEMIRQGLIDAAIMGEPYATWMTVLGHRRLFENSAKHTRLYAWAACDSLAESRQQAFRCLLDSATALLRSGQADSVLLLGTMRSEYGLPAALDTIALPAPAPVTDIREEDREAARAWLKRRASTKSIRHD